MNQTLLNFFKDTQKPLCPQCNSICTIVYLDYPDHFKCNKCRIYIDINFDCIYLAIADGVNSWFFDDHIELSIINNNELYPLLLNIDPVNSWEEFLYKIKMALVFK